MTDTWTAEPTEAKSITIEIPIVCQGEIADPYARNTTVAVYGSWTSGTGRPSEEIATPEAVAAFSAEFSIEDWRRAAAHSATLPDPYDPGDSEL